MPPMAITLCNFDRVHVEHRTSDGSRFELHRRSDVKSATLILDRPGRDPQITAPNQPLERLEVRLEHDARVNVVLNGAVVSEVLSIVGEGASEVVITKGAPTPVIRVEISRCSVELAGFSEVEQMRLDTAVVTGRGKVDHLIAVGAIAWDRFAVRNLEARGTVELGAAVSVEQLSGLNGNDTVLLAGGENRVKRCNGITLTTSVEWASIRIEQVIEDCAVIGAVSLSIAGDANRIRFQENQGLPRLTLLEPCRAEAFSGPVELIKVGHGAAARSDSTHRLEVRSVAEEVAGELLGVDIYPLDWRHVARLAGAERLTIWRAPFRQRYRLEAQQERPEPQRNFSIDELESRAEKWTRLAELLDEKVSDGTSVTQARYAAYRWRTKLAWRRDHILEAALLLMFKVVGYGQRVLQPLLVWIGAAGLLAMLPALEHRDMWLDRFGSMLLAPLAILRLTADPSPHTWEIVVAKLVGIVCIGFAILATRRLTRID